MKKIETTLLILFFIIGLWSCDTSNMFVGGGAAPDISAPECFITTPENLAYESGTFTIAGTATDNIKVTKVLLTVSRNGSLMFDHNNPLSASIAGNYWSYNFEGLESGEYEITATAYDKAGNFSENSSKSIVITVDNEPSTIVIQKPNLKPKATLEKLDYRDYANIEYFQNKTFSIRGSVDDEYPLKEITLQLLKGTECVYSLTFDSKFSENKELSPMVEGSLYNWTVKIDSMQKKPESGAYINKLGSLNPAEKQYLELSVIVTDKAGNKTADSNSSRGFICLYQEADRPWVEVSSLVNADTFEEQQEKNKLNSGVQITGSAYDDDLLDTLEFRIVNTDDNKLVKYETITKASFGDTSFTTWDLTAPANQGRYRLYYRLKDNNGITSYENGVGWNEAGGWDDTYSIGFQVIDESAPVTEIAAFENYPETAYITEENPAFIIKGTTRDSAGISQIMLAWAPNADEEKVALLRKEKWNITESGYHDGVKYWLVNLAEFENKQENNIFKMEWSCEIPVDDFVSADGTRIFDYKKMYYCTVSSSENYAVGTFTIPREFSEPKLTFLDSLKNGETYRNVGSDRFVIEGTCSDEESGVASLVIKYKKSSGEEAEYDVLKNGKFKDGNWSVTSDLLAELGGSFQRIVVKASDNFGNINQSSISIIVDNDSPRVSSITTEQSGGFYPAGKVLNFMVTMNREVEVKGDGLVLELNCGVDTNGNPVYAQYENIEENKILKFKYEVKKGDSAEPLDYVSVDSLKLSDGTKVVGKATERGESAVSAELVLPVPGESGSLASRGIFIDTEKPYVKQITADVGEGEYNANTKIKISAQFNENVSGCAKILLNSREKKLDNFVQMENSVKNTDTLEFIYTVKDGDNAETLDIFAPFYAYSEAETIKDSAGNEMDFNNFPQDSESGSLASLRIKIDTIAPEIKGVYVSEISAQPYGGEGNKYYLNTGKTVMFEVEFNEAVVIGSRQPYLELSALGSNNGEVQAQYKSGTGTSILSFIYTVANGDNSSGDLTCVAFNGDVTDVAGNAVLDSIDGVNEITKKLKKVTRSNPTTYSDISIIIDTIKPRAPTFEFVYTGGASIAESDRFTQKDANNYVGKTAGYIENIKVTPKAADVEEKAVMKIFASVGGKTQQDWVEQTDFSTTTDNAEENWIVKAQLIDYAGNVSDISSASFMVDKGVPQLSAINTTLASGLYKAGTQIPVMLVFSKKVNAVKSGSDDIEVEFKNGGKAVINTSSDYSALHKGIYTVGKNSDTDTNKLLVKSINGGKFSDSAGNVTEQNVEYGLTTSGSFTDDFKNKNIQIDTKAPSIDHYSIESISDAKCFDNDNYYLNAEKSVKIAVKFDEVVMICGDSFLKLSHGKNATYSGTSDDKMTLYYTYSVVSGDNSDELKIAENVYPTNIQDAAGNALNAGKNEESLTFNDKKIVIDTIPPGVPNVEIYKGGTSIGNAGNETFSEQVTLKISGDDGAQISYSINSGAKYDPYNRDVVLGDTGSEKTYYIVAKQVDKAGNTSEKSQKITITIDLRAMGISKISTTKLDGTYKAGDIIPITLLFTKKVSFTGLSLTLNSKSSALSGINSSVVALSHTINYEVKAGDECTEPLKVTALSGTFKNEAGNDVSDKITQSFGGLIDNFKDNKIQIDTVSPTITDYSVIEISDKDHEKNGYYLNAEDTIKLKVIFSEIVDGIGSSVLLLNSGESAVYLSGYGTEELIYEYKIQSGNTDELKIAANVYPTNIQDAAGNALKAGKNEESALTFDNKKIVINTIPPKAPVVKINGNVLGAAFSDVKTANMTVDGEESNSIEYSIDAGSSYKKYSSTVKLPYEINQELNTYRITARQTDLAGNMSASSALQSVTIDLRPIGIKSVSTTKPGGVYKAGAVIPLIVEFFKAITSEGNITLTLSNNASVLLKADGKSVYTINYEVKDGDAQSEALYVTSISGRIKDTVSDQFVSTFKGLGGNSTILNGNVNDSIAESMPNLAKSGESVIKIDTKAPSITDYSVESISDAEHSDSFKYYLNTGDTVEIAVEFGEAVTIGGDSSLALSNGKKAEYSGTSSDKKTLFYIYKVGSSGDNSDELKIAASVFPTNVQDTAGNALKAGKGEELALTFNDKKIAVDITCAAPSLSGITAGKIYSSAQTITLTGETGAAFYYSYDGGATEGIVSGNSFTTPTADGIYQITAYQVDIAGNKSGWAAPKEIIVDTAAPKIKSISTTAGDGIYKAGDMLTITVEFSESVTGNLTVALNSGASVQLSNLSGNTASANYTVAANQNTSKLSVASVSGNITDIARNAVSSFSGYNNFTGKNIKIDTGKPTITKYKVKKHVGGETEANKGTRTQDVAVDSKIVLQFDEKVSKGSGTIKVERIYKSYPAVMEADEYNTHKAGIGNYYIQRCIGTVDNAGAAPDTNAKYVLKYGIDHGAYESSNGLSSEQIAVYDYFADLDYNVTEIDVNSGLVKIETDSASGSYSLVTIQTPSKLKEGILYKVTFESGTFADEAGNGCDAEDGTSVQFETGPTATPVIRINKLSGRENGSQPFTTTVKISSEMYGATLYYGGSYRATTDNKKVITPENVEEPLLTNAGTTERTLSTPDTVAGAIFKLYAYTKKDGLTQGDTVKELAYKTVLYDKRDLYGFRGSDSSGGVSATTEFPFSWYETLGTAKATEHYLCSWHILKDFQFKAMKDAGNWSDATSVSNTKGYVGCYNEINVKHATGNEKSYTITGMPSNWGDAGAIQYVWVFSNSNDGQWVSANLNGTTITFSTDRDFTTCVAVRMDPNKSVPSWDAKWNQSADLELGNGTTSAVYK